MVRERELSESARLLLLASLLAKDGLISHNGKGFMKELVLRRDDELLKTFASFGSNQHFLQDLHSLLDRESRKLFDSLFVGLSLSEGKNLSKVERRRRGLMDDRALIYGEVDFGSFATILREVAAMTQRRSGGIFYDLGSGTGKAVFVARLTQDYDLCVGIEILQPLHSAAQIVTNRYNSHVRRLLDRGRPQNVAVYAGSFLECDWSDGDCVFANSTCFPEELMGALTRQAEELQPGSILVTFTKGVESEAFEVLSKRRFDMSWGPATVYIHRRRPYREAGSHTLHKDPVGLGLDRRGSTVNVESLAIEDKANGSTTSSSSRSNDSSVGPSDCSKDSIFDSDASGEKKSSTSVWKAISCSESSDCLDAFVPKEGTRNGGGAEMGRIRTKAQQTETEEVENGRIEEEKEEEQEQEEEETDLLFDTKQLQGARVDVNDRVTPSAVSKRFMGFGEMLRQAEKAQAQTLEQLHLSREALLAIPGDLTRSPRKREMEGPKALGDGSTEEDSGKAKGNLCDIREGEARREGSELFLCQGEREAEEKVEELYPDGQLKVEEGNSKSTSPLLMEVKEEITSSLSNSQLAGGEKSIQNTEEMQGRAVDSTADCKHAPTAPAAETVLGVEAGPASRCVSTPAAATNLAVGNEEDDQQEHKVEDEEEFATEDNGVSLQCETTATAPVSAVRVVGVHVEASSMTNGGGLKGNDDGLSDDGDVGNVDNTSGSNAQDCRMAGDAVENKEGKKMNGFDDVGGKKDSKEPVESASHHTHDTTESWPPPPPRGGGVDTVNTQASNRGAEAARDCCWLPISLPTPTPSTPRANSPKDQTETLEAAVQAGRRNSTLSSVAEVELRNSPQQTTIVQHKPVESIVEND